FPIYHQLPEPHGPAVALWRLEAAELGVQSLVVLHLLRECSRDFLTQFGSLRDDEYVLVTVEGQLPQRETDRHDACLSMSGRDVEEEPSMGQCGSKPLDRVFREGFVGPEVIDKRLEAFWGLLRVGVQGSVGQDLVLVLGGRVVLDAAALS